MAEEKGLIALNHCNNIANAIITKLGDTGYKPSEWREKVNLLGISSANKSEVLAGLTPEASGEEAGVIDLETISGLAEELNEKYTTIRGFKPSEMRGAISAMSPLEEKTATGSIAHYTDGAKNTPLTKCEVTLAPSVEGRNPATVSGSIVSFSDSAEVGLKACKVTIPASLDGVSSVDVVHCGKNLIDTSSSAWESGTINSSANNASGSGTRTIGYFAVKGGGTFTLSGVIAPSVNSDFRVFFYGENNDFISYQGYRAEYNIPENARYFRIRNISIEDISHMQIEYGSTATTYAPYVQPTTHTANLGRTVYGGEVDIVNGSGAETHKEIALSALTWTYDSTNSRFLSSAVSGIKIQSGRTLPMVCNNYTIIDDGRALADVPDMSIYNSGNSGGVYVHDARYTTVEDFLQNMGNTLLCYPLATPQAFTFPRVPIVPKAGVNTMWSAGDISVDYYKDGYGYEEVKVYHQGANFIDDTLDGIEQGTISGSTGRDVAGANRVRNAGYIRFPLDKLQANYTLTIPEGYKLAMRFYTENKTFVTPPSWAQGFINQIPAAYVGQNVQFARFILAKTDDSNITPEDIANAGFILNYGSSADTYEPYTEPEEKTKDLGGIVYGGSYDFVAGEGSVKYGRVVYTGESSENWAVTQASGIYRFYIRNDNVKAPESGRGVVYSSIGTYASTGYAVGTCYSSYSSSKVFIYYVPPQTVTTVEEFKAWLHDTPFDVVYEKAEPEAIEGTPEAIKSYFGVNTLWNEENDTTVGYYADIDLSSNTQNALNMVNLSQEEIE